jgi:hypothetical protein
MRQWEPMLRAGVLLFAAALSGCAGAAQALGFNPMQGSCGPPPPVVSPMLFFAYPGNGATNVPTTIGELVFSGEGATSVQLSGTSPVPTGPLQPAPSPLPSPLVTEPNPFSTATFPFFAVTIGTLAPATSYTVSYSFPQFTGTPPNCTEIATRALGSFTTR